MFSEPGLVLGKYQLIAEIARGGMGVVYLAMAQGPGGFHKLVVVKQLSPELVENPTFRTMFLDEARLAARLNHANIVQTNEVGSDGDRYFMVMDYLDGRGLDQLRRRARSAGFGPSPPMQLRILIDMLAGLDYAHNLTDFDGTPLHIVHRDVSPQNVFVTFDGQVKLLDFGIAKASDTTHQTHAGVLKGKIAYMSPEQARGLAVDARADVFSAGVMLWETLTGRSLRDGKNDQQMLWALAAGELPRVQAVKPWVPPELDQICARAMAHDRAERYPSAAALRSDLEAYLAAAGTNVSGFEVGVCISEMFYEDRARTNALIEAHVARVRGGAAHGAIPVIDVASRMAPSGTPSAPPSVSVPSGTPEPADAVAGTSSDGASSSSGVAPPPTGAQAPAPRQTPRPVIVAGAAIVATLTGVWLIAGRSPSEPRPAPAPIAAPPALSSERPAAAPAAAVAPGPRLVNVEIRVSPATATLEIDDRGVAGNPFAGSFVSDTAAHHVRATAPGYVTKSVTVGFDGNVTLDLSLERLPASATAVPASAQRPAQRSPARPAAIARPAAPARPVEVSVAAPPPAPVVAAPAPPAAEPRPPTPPPEVGPSGGQKPRRVIDSSNPYEGE